MPFSFGFWSAEQPKQQAEQSTQQFDIFSQIMATSNRYLRAYRDSTLDTQLENIQQLKFQALTELDRKNYSATMAKCDLALEVAQKLNTNWIEITRKNLNYQNHGSAKIPCCELSQFLIEELHMIIAQAEQQKPRNYIQLQISFKTAQVDTIRDIQQLKFDAMNLVASGNLSAALAKYELALEHTLPKLRTDEAKRLELYLNDNNIFEYPLEKYLGCEIYTLKNNVLEMQRAQEQQRLLAIEWKESPSRNKAVALLAEPEVAVNINVILEDITRVWEVYKSNRECFSGNDETVFKELDARKIKLELLQQKQQDNQVQQNVHDNMYTATQKLDAGDIPEALDLVINAQRLARQIKNPNNIAPQSYTPIENFNVAITELQRILEKDYEVNRDLFAAIYADTILAAVIKNTSGRSRGATVLFSTHELDLKTTIKDCITQHWKKFYARSKPQQFVDDLTTLVTARVKSIGNKKWSADLLFLRRSNTSIDNAESVMRLIKGSFVEYVPTVQIPIIPLALFEPYRREIAKLPFGTIASEDRSNGVRKPMHNF
jgi:hypothetical protein